MKNVVIFFFIIIIPFLGHSQIGYDIKFNGVSISDPSINDVVLPGGQFLTETGYRYTLQEFDSAQLASLPTTIIDTSVNVYRKAPYWVTISQGNIFELNIGDECQPRSVGIFYVPLDAKAIEVDSSYYPVQCGKWQPYPYPYKLYEAIRNNPKVTGYNLPKRVKISYVRK
jgi:hypothetical protein